MKFLTPKVGFLKFLTQRTDFQSQTCWKSCVPQFHAECRACCSEISQMEPVSAKNINDIPSRHSVQEVVKYAFGGGSRTWSKNVKTRVLGCAWRGIQNMVFKSCLYCTCLGRDHILCTFSPCSEYPSRHTPRPLFSQFLTMSLCHPWKHIFYHFLDFPGYSTCRGYP